MKVFIILFTGLLSLDQYACLPDEFKTETRGYGNTHETVMRPRCDYPTVMAVRDMYVTSKKISLGCPDFIQAGTVYDPSCIQVEEGDCSLEFDLTKREPYLECTGKIECDVGTDWQRVLRTCGSSYMTDSHIMSMDYNCIRSADILKFNVIASKTVATEAYISNEGFPNAMTSSSAGTCFITSCSAGIVIGLIDLRLSKSGGICQQSVKIIDGGTTTVVGCDDNNNLQYRQRYTSVTASVYVTLTVTSSTPDSFAWVDVSGDKMAVYCGVTEVFTPSSLLDCTTTTSTSTTAPGLTQQTNPAPGTSRNTEVDSSTQGTLAIAVSGLVIGILALVGASTLALVFCFSKRGVVLDNGVSKFTLKSSRIVPESPPKGLLEPIPNPPNVPQGDAHGAVEIPPGNEPNN